jgi:hypothetical protein
MSHNPMDIYGLLQGELYLFTPFNDIRNTFQFIHHIRVTISTSILVVQVYSLCFRHAVLYGFIVKR